MDRQAPDFVDHPKVVNGASDLMVEVLGDAGRHARFAVGAPSLPFVAFMTHDFEYVHGFHGGRDVQRTRIDGHARTGGGQGARERDR